MSEFPPADPTALYGSAIRLDKPIGNDITKEIYNHVTGIMVKHVSSLESKIPYIRLGEKNLIYLTNTKLVNFCLTSSPITSVFPNGILDAANLNVVAACFTVDLVPGVPIKIPYTCNFERFKIIISNEAQYPLYVVLKATARHPVEHEVDKIIHVPGNRWVLPSENTLVCPKDRLSIESNVYCTMILSLYIYEYEWQSDTHKYKGALDCPHVEFEKNLSDCGFRPSI